jgi:hypothetical protein
MPANERPLFNLDALLAEIAEDEKADCQAKRILSHDDIRKMVEESRRRRQAATQKAQPS